MKILFSATFYLAIFLAFTYSPSSGIVQADFGGGNGKPPCNERFPDNQWTAHTLDLQEYENATCLDGSPGMYYIQKGSAIGKVLVMAWGGAWCDFRDTAEMDNCGNARDCCSHHGIANSCSARANTSLGSSTKMENPSKWDWACDGMTSPDAEVNPAFHDWTKIKLLYCDGASFSGLNTEAIDLNGEKVWSRGNFIYQAVIADVKKEGKPLYAGNNPTHLVLNGNSAGGLATYLHAHQWKESLPDTINIAVMPDDGFFHYTDKSKHLAFCPMNYNEMMKNIFDRINPKDGLSKMCLENMEKENRHPYECMFAVNALPYIEHPVFVLQSPYDEWQTEKVVVLDEEKNKTAFIEFGQEFKQTVLDVLQSRSNSLDGIFMDSCKHHTVATDGTYYQNSMIDGMAMNEAIAKWVNWWTSGGNNGESVKLIADISNGTHTCKHREEESGGGPFSVGSEL
mmetsp:Transcript_8076/g.11736  ORF Transcript_8076/g.11736 Transcript_8076/m.11736 type:complete len:454 (-) Transcript_8076:81-1442(-)